MARRPRPTVSASNSSATSTNSVMMSAVKISPIPSAATIAIAIESSIVIRRWTRSSNASR